jgi:hypothetical protein
MRIVWVKIPDIFADEKLGPRSLRIGQNLAVLGRGENETPGSTTGRR